MFSTTAAGSRSGPGSRTLAVLCFLIGLTLVATAALSVANMWRAQRLTQAGAVRPAPGAVPAAAKALDQRVQLSAPAATQGDGAQLTHAVLEYRSPGAGDGSQPALAGAPAARATPPSVCDGILDFWSAALENQVRDLAPAGGQAAHVAFGTAEASRTARRYPAVVIDYGVNGIHAFVPLADGSVRAVHALAGTVGTGQEVWNFLPWEIATASGPRNNDGFASGPARQTGTALPVSACVVSDPPSNMADNLSHHEVRDTGGRITNAYLFLTARAKGTYIYGLEVTAPQAPRKLWRHAAHDDSDRAFDDLALTFSAAQPARIAGRPESASGNREGIAPQVTRRYALRLTDGAPVTPSVALSPGRATNTLSAAKSRTALRDG